MIQTTQQKLFLFVFIYKKNFCTPLKDIYSTIQKLHSRLLCFFFFLMYTSFAQFHSGDTHMKNFHKTDLIKAYKMIKGDRTKIIATKSKDFDFYNLTPIDWCMPMDYDPVTRVIFSCNPKHQCDINIREHKEFALCIPQTPQERIINSCGSVSDPNADKFKMFNILGTKASQIDVLLPMENIESWIECKLLRIIRVGSVDLIIGEAVAAYEQSDIA